MQEQIKKSTLCFLYILLELTFYAVSVYERTSQQIGVEVNIIRRYSRVIVNEVSVR